MANLKKLFCHADFKLAWLLLGIYIILAALAILHYMAASGDMAGMVFVLLALPWPNVLNLFFGESGVIIGFLGGLLLNPILLFLLGYYVSRFRKRSGSGKQAV